MMAIPDPKRRKFDTVTPGASPAPATLRATVLGEYGFAETRGPGP
jgi:hypothetical protein